MNARYIIGDVFQVLATLDDNSVDLVVTSPPFLALRSYLPADHPDKAKEIGSEPTPAAFIDTLLDVVEALDRVLAPHGSICIELGDTYSGSGGAGGDYNENGLREGQQKFRQHNLYANHPSGEFGQGRPATSGETLGVVPMTGGDGWPEAKSLCLIPESFRWALVYGRNPFNGRLTPPWRARNVIRWVRPNPPVGALGDKFRPATSEMVVLCKSRDRYFDLDAVRNINNPDRMDEKPMRSPKHQNGLGSSWESKSHGENNPAGAPPLDWWNIPTQPYSGSHYATFPEALVIRPIKSMCPPYVCPSCGPIYPIQSNHDESSLSGMWEGNHQPESQNLLRESVRVNGSSQYTVSPDTSTRRPAAESATRLRGSPLARPSDGIEVGLSFRASSDNGELFGPDTAAHGSGSSQEWDPSRQPDRKLRSDGQDSTLSHSYAETQGKTVSPLRGSVGDGGSCPRCGCATRVGLVLDPFCGSGTTLQVATGHGRHAIGIDLDESNAALALNRVGPLLLEVIDGRKGPRAAI